ncbi:MAG: helix-turn-helix transcriptional regulator [Candidatus Eremiobacteraeota bacterium]|nr:helix-turn-helix transcriptional regulator [Candidatus Eremiobacteraeota bacterium]
MPPSTRVVAFGGPHEGGLPPKGTPKNYLMAWLLVMLADKSLHGYEITKELNEKFEVITDAGTVYRALRQLERVGYISSWWNPTEQGPPRRLYALTQNGEGALLRWSEALDQYRANLEMFFALYERRHERATTGRKGA